MKYLAVLDIASEFIKGGLSAGFDISALKDGFRAFRSYGMCNDLISGSVDAPDRKSVV